MVRETKMKLEVERSRLAFCSLVLSIVVASGKGVLAYLTGSAALLAETLHSISDLAASFAVWVGVRITRISSSEFPYGLYKAENLVSLFSAVAIFFAGYEFARKSLEAPIQDGLQYLPAAVAGLTVIIIVVYAFANYVSVKGLEFNSPALKAEAGHLKTDIASTAVVLAGLIGSEFGLRFLDRVAALIVVVFVARTGWRILVDAMRSLLDASVDRATLDNIRSVVMADPRVKAIKTIVARNSGSVIFINLDLVCSLDSLEKVNSVREEIASAVRATVPHVEGVQIIVEPVVKDYLLVAVPLADQDETVSDHFGKAPYIALLKVKKKSCTVEEKTILLNPFAHEEKGKGIRLAHFLLGKKVDIFYTREPLDGKGPAYIMEAGGINIRKTAGNSLADVLTQISRGESEGQFTNSHPEHYSDSLCSEVKG